LTGVKTDARQLGKFTLALAGGIDPLPPLPRLRKSLHELGGLASNKAEMAQLDQGDGPTRDGQQNKDHQGQIHNPIGR
jgi:hypothetical protein